MFQLLPSILPLNICNKKLPSDQYVAPNLIREGETNIANMDRLGLSPVPSEDVDVIMKKSQTRMWKILQGEPQFIISVASSPYTANSNCVENPSFCRSLSAFNASL
jgi:hypothetical protein